MIIAQAQDLEQRFGGNTIFSNISFSVPDNARIGLVGPNGAGKTTLLKIMTGQQEPTSGQFTINKGLKVGYIAQENALDEDKTIWDEMLTVFDNLIEKNKRITKMQEQIAEHPEDEDLLKRYDQLAYDFEQEGGFTYQAEIKSILNGFNFKENTWQKVIGTLSGGEKTRLAFVKLLLQKPHPPDQKGTPRQTIHPAPDSRCRIPEENTTAVWYFPANAKEHCPYYR